MSAAPRWAAALLLVACGARRAPPEPLLSDAPVSVEVVGLRGQRATVVVETRTRLQAEALSWSVVDAEGAPLSPGGDTPLAAPVGRPETATFVVLALPSEALQPGARLVGTVHARGPLGTEVRAAFSQPLPPPPAAPPGPPGPPASAPDSAPETP